MADYSVLGLHQNPANGGARQVPVNRDDDFVTDLFGAVDNTPKLVAGFALGGLAVLFALKAMKFRFVFGANTSIGR